MGKRWLTGSAIASAAFVALVLVGAVAGALTTATDFTGYGVDGPFQLYNPLRRLADGEVAGRDFPFFHGVGVLLLHYPMFELFGGNLYASEMTRWILSPIVFLASGYAIAYAVFRDWRRALVGLAVYTALVTPIGKMIDPSNSLLGIRSTLPLLAAAAFLWTPRRRFTLPGRVPFSVPTAVGWLCLGAAVSFGTEQGLAAIGAFVLVRFVQALATRLGFVVAVLRTALDGVAALLLALIISTILTSGHPFEAFSYALSDVSGDQGWVFGAPPNVPLTWGSLLWDLRGGPTFALTAVPIYWMTAILGVLLVALAVWRRRAPAALAWALAYWVVYGTAVLAAVIGYINLSDQMSPLARVGCLAVALAITALAFGTPDRAVPPAAGAPAEAPVEPAAESAAVVGTPAAAAVAFPAPQGRRGERTLAVLATIAVGGILVGGTPARAADLAEAPLGSAVAAAGRAYGQSDYVNLGQGWKAAYDSFDEHLEGDDFWSTYATVYESIRGTRNSSPGGEDYIIHALGPERRDAYGAAFRAASPGSVITLNPTYSIYEEWLWSRWPDVYAELFERYGVVAENASHHLWQPLDEPRETGTEFDVPAVGEGDAVGFPLPANDTETTRLYRVEVDYATDAPLAVLERLPRYLLTTEGTGLVYPISLPQYEETWTFFVPVLPGQTEPRLAPFVFGVGESATLTVDEVRATEITVDPTLADYFLFTYCTSMFYENDRTDCPPDGSLFFLD